MFTTEAIQSLVFSQLLFLVSETPRHLELNNQDEKALSILNRVYHSVEHSKKVLADIISTLEIEV